MASRGTKKLAAMNRLWRYRWLRPLIRGVVFDSQWRQNFYMGMRQMIQNGSLKDAIESGYDLAFQKGTSDILLYDRLRKAFDEGRSVAGALQDFLPAEESIILLSGESSQDPAEPYAVASRFLVSMQDVRKGIRGLVGQAFFWAFFVSVIFLFMMPMMLEGIMIAAKSMPNLVKPGSGLDTYLHRYEQLRFFLPFIAAVIVLYVVVSIFLLPRWRVRPMSPSAQRAVSQMTPWRAWLRRKAGALREWMDYKTQPYRAYRETKAVGLLFSIGSLLRAGVPLSNAFAQMRPLSPKYLEDYLELMQVRKDAGRKDSEVFDVPLFSLSSRIQLSKFVSGGKNSADSVNFVAGNEAELMQTRISRLKRNVYLVGMTLGAAGLMFVYAGIYFLFMAVNDFKSSLYMN